MLRGLGRIASLAIVLALATGLVGCSQYGKLQAKRAFKEANVLYAQQEYKRAAVLYEEAITNDPELSVAYFYLANSYDNLFKPSRKGEPENDAYLTKAIEYYTKASEKEKDPTLRKRSFEFLVAAYGPDKMNDPSQQEPIVNRMIQLDPQDATNYFALANIREQAGDYPKAEEVLLQAKQARPERPAGLPAARRVLQPPGGVREDDRGPEPARRDRAEQSRGVLHHLDLLLGQGLP